jgi:hypothetical protein
MSKYDSTPAPSSRTYEVRSGLVGQLSGRETSVRCDITGSDGHVSSGLANSDSKLAESRASNASEKWNSRNSGK